MNLNKVTYSWTSIKQLFPRIKFLTYAMNSDVGTHWRGVPLTEIYGSQSPWGSAEFPLVVPAYNHAVLYHVPSSGNIADDRPPKPQIGHDKWDHEYVRMPCSSQSLYPVEDSNGESHLKKRWEIIENTLWKPIRNSRELADAIITYNTKNKNIWKFRALHKLFEEYLEEEESQFFFDVTLPEIAKLALALPRLIQSPIPLLKQHRNRSVSLSQQQIASLLANAFFCTFPRRNTTKKASEYATYPHINFNTLYEASGCDSVLEKLKCICHYFRRVTTKVPVGAVTFTRRSVPPRGCPAWLESTARVAALPVHVHSETTIEDAHGLIQVDFANKYLGGGVLGHGCVQEEIRFVICPELMVSMLITEVLRPNEALMMIGCERYNSYTGYGNTFQWAGDYRDSTPYDSSGRRRCAVLAIDALPYSSVVQEYRKEAITRELNKAWVGFSFYTDLTSDSLQYPGVATGNWGCGAFGGTPQLKSLLQIMACTQAKRPMAYYTFQDTDLRDEIINIYNLLARYNVTVGQLYKYILRFSCTDVRKSRLHDFILQALRDEHKPKSPRNNQPQNAQEKMETSDTTIDLCTQAVIEETNTEQYELPDSLQREFLNTSPDLFSQDEIYLSQNEPENLNKETIEQDDSRIDDNTSSAIDKMEAGTNMASGTIKIPSNHTSLLFEEMKKFDEENARLNFNDTPPSILNQSRNATINVSDTPTTGADDKIKMELSSEVKKKISKKITDYFSKKPI